ncbi:hypothetical protein ABT324_23385 [Saccharopolyspora sp. NPDC000359]|uniref:hypothetical protein n=1 Tax=Saccharopolyspora sp. NPDC000359 TaxID=3154251 RepID=UPI00333472FC
MQPQQPGQWGPPPGGQFPQQQQPVQQPYPQAPPPGYPQFQQQPPRKRKGRVGLIIGISAGALVLLGVGGFFLMAYLDYSEPAGSNPSNAALPEECALVDKGTLHRLHVTNPDPTVVTDNPDEGLHTCGWEPTKGRDGNNLRRLRVDVKNASAAGSDAESVLEDNRPSDAEDVTGLGDEAYIVLDGPGAPAELTLRKGQKIATITYSGKDSQFLGDNVDMPVPEAEEAVRSVAEEVAPAL